MPVLHLERIRKQQYTFMEKIYYVYALIDPTDQKIKYIGQSTNPELRFRTHLNKPSPLMRKWIKSLVEQNLQPTLNILEVGDKSNINELELKHIKLWGDNKLFNIKGNDKNSYQNLKKVINQRDIEIQRLKRIINSISGVKGFTQMINKLRGEIKQELIQEMVRKSKY